MRSMNTSIKEKKALFYFLYNLYLDACSSHMRTYFVFEKVELIHKVMAETLTRLKLACLEGLLEMVS